jgi:hypothetical protein
MIYTAFFKSNNAVICEGRDWWDARCDALSKVPNSNKGDIFAMVPGIHRFSIVFSKGGHPSYPLAQSLDPMLSPEDR